MSELVDSGVRQEFTSGAVRDIQEGKGRCDLLPLDVVAVIITQGAGSHDRVLEQIQQFISEGSIRSLYRAITYFCETKGWDIYTAVLEVSKHYEDGARKYSERNWEKGIPLHCFLNSGVRHYLKFLRGDNDEPHDRAFLWNMLGCLWTLDHHPKLNDLPFSGNKNIKEE